MPMVGDGPADCCHSSRTVHASRRVCSGRRALGHMYFIRVYIHMYLVPFPYLKPFVLVPRLHTVCSLISGGRFVDPLSPNLHTEGNFPVRFSRRKSIGFPKLYRLTSSFFALHKYFDMQIWGQCVVPGAVWCSGTRPYKLYLPVQPTIQPQA